MSQENVETLREAYELLNTRFAALKGGEVDERVDHLDHDLRIEEGQDPQVVQRRFRPLGRYPHRSRGLQRFGPVDRRPASYISARRGEWCRVLVRDYGRRAGMAVEASVIGGAVWTVRDGKIAKVAFYLNRSEALEAVGLSE